MAPATTSSAISSARTAASSSTPPRSRKSATTIRSAARTTGSGRPAAPTTGVSACAITNASTPPSRPIAGVHDVRPRRGAGGAAAYRLSDLYRAAHGGERRAGVLHARAAGGAAPEPFRRDRRLRAARGAVLHLRRRADVARLGGAAHRRFRAGGRRARAGKPGSDRGRHLGDLR